MTALACILVAMGVAMLVATPGAWAAPPPASGPALVKQIARSTDVKQVRAVALSHDAQYLASIVVRDGKPELTLAGWSGSHRLPVAIPGPCPVAEIRWAPRGQWHELAVLTRCHGDPADGEPIHGALWVLNLSAHNTAPRKIADIDGFASGLEWSVDLKHIAFLFVPGATHVLETTTAGKVGYGAFGDNGVRFGADHQYVGMVALAGGSPRILTPGNLYVYAFRLAPIGHDIAYTAATIPVDGGQENAKLYVQDTRRGAAPRMIVDPATVGGPLHGLRIGLLRWWPPATQIFFIGGNMTNLGAIAGDIYAVPISGGRPVDLISGGKAASVWFRFLAPNSLFVTQIVDGRVHAVEYTYFATYMRQTYGWFSVPYLISDGRDPLAVSIGGPHMAFISGPVD
ncbi:MAG: hypothetical protein ACRET0_15240 [Steroidobacteraceae bacterium]